MKRSYLLMSVLLSIGLLTSCSSSDTVETAENTGPHKFQITLQGAQYNTRASANYLSTDESKVNNLIIGVFNGAAVDNIQSLDNTKFTLNSNISITSTTKTPDVIVVANVPSNTFAGVTTKAGFIGTINKLTNTARAYDNTGSTPPSDLYDAAGSSQLSASLPMVGSVTDASTTHAVTLYRMVSQIVINSIKEDFSPTGAYASSTFLPKEIFMAGVPSESTFSTPWGTAAPANGQFPTVTTLVSGETGTTGAVNYLSSGSLTASANTEYATPNYFYVFPNTYNPVSPETDIDVQNKIRLIIKGDFTKDGKTETIYYPIVIGRTQSGTIIKKGTDTDAIKDADKAAVGVSNLGGVFPNQTYAISVTIRSKGATDTKTDIQPSDVNVSVSVAPWNAALTQDVIFN